ncbi:MAG: antibiotic transport system permease protein [Parcubacteria group bacterium Gr01-1014_70]|nr:MAG: antibiotic transport system permease protein [Parcubacteria group bacterium Gr01-1014_70]
MNTIGLWTFIRRELRRFLRVGIQTLITPWISALLYIFVFGRVVGARINWIQGVEYIDFVLPGILMMNIIMSAFMQTAFGLYFQRFTRHIEEVLVAPLAYWEMIIGHIIGGVLRAVLVGLGIYVIAIFFSAANFAHVGLFIFYALSVAVLFSFIGLLIGLWAQNFEQLNILNTFVIMPLSFLGGMFNSITMLPLFLQRIVLFNPFFYFIDGIRYAMIGIRETNAGIGVAVIIGSLTVLGGLVWHLFRIGYRLRV